ncbi:hypothetical protein J7T55_005303 [Diaporthe amygdali]|uniref:uncharacterized protein n=1 Tax=Phomopsis amygdali TaxID=1214568 RepID=UPI0022FE4E22|nr:uncharacterized protein J7T55_005303 [Diaporthe amygdali]KAJ0108326.1 hypothetical protein J7T55_005303 [Diaporthe amygdali]
MEDSSRSQDNVSDNTQTITSENTPSELDQRSRSASSDASDLDALDAEFNEAEKAAAEKEPDETVADADELAPKGAICEVKEIFDTKTSNCGCCTEWVDEKPERDRNEKNQAAEDRRAQFSVIRRMTPHGGGWKTHSILINSHRIQSSLAKVFEGYPVTYADDHDLELSPKFIPFCHRWDKLLEVERDEPEAETKNHLTLLRSTLEIDLADSLKRRDLVARTGFATFHDLELLFEPGQIVIHRDDNGILSAGVVGDVTLEGPSFDQSESYLVKVDITAWNGERFGVAEREWRLVEFSGTRKVHSLNICPLHMHPDHEKISRELIERGKKYESLRGQHFLAYAGKAGSKDESLLDQHFLAYAGKPGSKYIRDRVIIDEYGYWDLNNYYLPSLKPFGKSTEAAVIRDGGDRASSENSTEIAADTEDTYPSQAGSADHNPLTNDQLLLASSCITGFALKNKKFYDLAVDHILEIDWIPDLMSRLVLDQDIKDLILALLDYKTTQATDDREIFDDFVPGKGKGIVMLLCAPPGVGKTLAAEAVSEHLKSPLYRVNMQDLGSEASTVEGRLQTALERCSRWNAVLLLDEADVFLEQRTLDSLQRNELVSVFLRTLEYYEGAMILTTNRAASLDPAFESRIDMTLVFEDLTKDARRQIWDGFLRESKTPTQLSDEDLDRLADWQLNGRQIKSAVKTASIFASKQGGPMTMKHLDVVITLRNSSGALLGSAKTT